MNDVSKETAEVEVTSEGPIGVRHNNSFCWVGKRDTGRV